MGQTAPSIASGPAPAIWSFAYVGVHGGHGSADASYAFDTFVGPEAFDHDPQKWFGGGQIGVQQQWGRAIVGIEGAFSGLRLNDTVESTLLPGRFRSLDINSLLTVTARLGYASDRWIAYVKGGLAKARVDTLVYMNNAGTGSATKGREDGWTVGAGIELLCAHGFLVGLEYDYVRLNIGDRDGLLPDLKPFTYSDISDGIQTLTVRLSYKFGPEPRQPVLK